MYTISPEDRLRLVVRQQNQLRDEMARERLAAAAEARPTTAHPARRAAGRALIRHVEVMAQHILHAITGRHAATPHGATH